MNSPVPERSEIAAVVVLYHPDSTLLQGISTYCKQVDRVYAIDNSETANSAIADRLELFENLIYLPNHANLGIASALNRGAELALEDGYRFLLTMDQDSQADATMIHQQRKVFDALAGERIGIIAPFHLTKANRRPPEAAISDVMTPMTSGCLLNLQAYQDVGGFRDDFFIDFVDNEYSLRLRRQGWRVVRANFALLNHNVGDICKFGPFIATNHSPLRRYYKTRNRFQVFREYVLSFPGHCLFDLVRLTKEIGSIILFERDKLSKLGMMARGFIDFTRGISGRYEG